MELPFHHNAKPKIFENARFLKKVPTEAERLLWRNLRSKKLKGYKFRRQHPIDHFIVDFYCHECRLVIEVDGDIHFQNDNPAYDKGRTEQLDALGVKIIRFTNEQVLKDISSVLSEITKHLTLPNS
ncbi:MAG TPA: endonuclease domain-containing protein [Cyclobacteriaceae bacterium]|nr:endonuclease domain-containing protein [Cyclobacteriaceae bacterium]HRJ82932.1 endonuclease domain-containing protein [Cyclobacteriaceae bacterium]